jgi:hypothetical protein
MILSWAKELEIKMRNSVEEVELVMEGVGADRDEALIGGREAAYQPIAIAIMTATAMTIATATTIATVTVTVMVTVGI